MKRVLGRLRRFFFPPAESPLLIRALPYAVLGVLTLLIPPEYTAYQTSPQARIDFPIRAGDHLRPARRRLIRRSSGPCCRSAVRAATERTAWKG